MISLVNAIGRARLVIASRRATYVEERDRPPARTAADSTGYPCPHRGTTATVTRSEPPHTTPLLPRGHHYHHRCYHRRRSRHCRAVASRRVASRCVASHRAAPRRGRVSVPRARRETPTANSPGGGLTRTVTSLAPKRVAVSGSGDGIRARLSLAPSSPPSREDR